jgi:hypothetical protein
MQFQKNDGGRAAAGYKASTDDSLVRAIVIASQRPYEEIYDRLAEDSKTQRPAWAQLKGDKPTSKIFVNANHKWFKDYMRELGFDSVSLNNIPGGSHNFYLKDGGFPMGRLVVRLGGHYAAVIDGVLHDTYDSSAPSFTYSDNNGVIVSEECQIRVFGFWKLRSE